MIRKSFKDSVESGQHQARCDVITQHPLARLEQTVAEMWALCATEVQHGDLVPFEDHEAYAQAMRRAARLLDAAAMIHEDAAARNRAEFFGGVQ